jgi:outer membrane immunogenic protein
MKRAWIASGVLGAVIAAGPATAADPPPRYVAMKAAPVSAAYDWSGFYAGVNAGAAWGSYDPITSTTFAGGAGYLVPANVAAVNAAGAQEISPTGFAGGTQGGYNWQRGQWVFGLESDINAVRSASTGSAASGYSAPKRLAAGLISAAKIPVSAGSAA